MTDELTPVTRQEFDALSEKVDRVLNILSTRYMSPRVHSLSGTTNDAILRDFLIEMVYLTSNPNDKITRSDLYHVYMTYAYHWLRREATYNGMSEAQAQAAYTGRLSATGFARQLRRLSDEGRLPGLADGHIKNQRAWCGVQFRPAANMMNEQGYDFELPLRGKEGA